MGGGTLLSDEQIFSLHLDHCQCIDLKGTDLGLRATLAGIGGDKLWDELGE